jgi:integrase
MKWDRGVLIILSFVEGRGYSTTNAVKEALWQEILGLKWSDVDFQKKQISINRTFNMGRFFTPKTKGSARRIDLSPMAAKALAEWKLASGGQADANNEEVIKELLEKERALMAQSTDGAKSGEPSPALRQELSEIRAKVKRLRGVPLVFPNESGEPMNYSNMVHRYYRKALKDAEIPQIIFHNLRHTYASLLLSQGENVKYIQTQMGHSSPTVTLNVYAHLRWGKTRQQPADWKTPFLREPVTIWSQTKIRG